MYSLINFRIIFDKSSIRIDKVNNKYIDEIKEILEDHNITYVDFNNFITIIGDRQCMKALYWLSTEFYIGMY